MTHGCRPLPCPSCLTPFHLTEPGGRAPSFLSSSRAELRCLCPRFLQGPTAYVLHLGSPDHVRTSRTCQSCTWMWTLPCIMLQNICTANSQ